MNIRDLFSRLASQQKSLSATQKEFKKAVVNTRELSVADRKAIFELVKGKQIARAALKESLPKHTTLAQRADSWLKSRREAVEEVLLGWVPGLTHGTEVEVSHVAWGSNVTEKIRYLGHYSSRCTYQKKGVRYDFWVNVPAFLAVPAHLRELGGLLTTRIYASHRVGEVEVCKAEWLAKGRGSSVRFEQGRIIVVAGEAYHVPLTDHRPLRRIVGSLRQRQTREQLRGMIRGVVSPRSARDFLQACLAGQIRDFDDKILIRRADSIRSGNCVPGTDSFIERNELEGEITLAEFRQCDRCGYTTEIERALAGGFERAYVERRICLSDVQRYVSQLTGEV